MVKEQAAVFLDRDGVIIEDVNFITRPEQVKFIDKSAEAISLLNKKFKVIIVSNQPAVGRGLCNEEDAKKINEMVIFLLSKKNAKIDNIYMCFHHPLKGIGKYKIECECRKPKPGMLLKAAREHNIDLSKSFMIGDKIGDIKAGHDAGCKTILVKTGYGGNDGFNDADPDFIVKDLYEGVKKIILGGKK